MSTTDLDQMLSAPDAPTPEQSQPAASQQIAPDPAQAAAQGTGEPAAPPAATQPIPDGYVPRAALEDERRKRKENEAAMATARAEIERRDELLRRIAAERQRQPQQPGREGNGVPDPVTDPEAFHEYVARSNRTAFVNATHSYACQRYGDDRVAAALQAAEQAGVSPYFAWKSQRPWDDLMDWYSNQEVRSMYGTTPDTVEEKVLAKYGLSRAELQARAQAAQPQPQSQQTPSARPPVPQPPTSLAAVTSSHPRSATRNWTGPPSLDEILG